MAKVEMLDIPVSLDREMMEQVLEDLRRIQTEAMAAQRELKAVLVLRAQLADD